MSERPERQHYGITLGVLALAALSYALLQTMVAPALPEIQRDLGATTTQVTWVLTVYLLTASVATPILGRVGDIIGKERTLVGVLVLFAIGSLISALSHGIELLVAGRAVQGAAGAVFPLAFGIIRDEFPRERVATGHRPDLGHLRDRRRGRPRAQRRDRRPPLLRVDLLVRPGGRAGRDRRDAPVHPRVAGEVARADRLDRRGACCPPGWSRCCSR